MEDSLSMIGGQLEKQISFQAECSYCYNSASVDENNRKEAAKEFHSIGWRFANKIPMDDGIVIGLVCPECSQRMNLIKPDK